MEITAISDLHGEFPRLDGGDLLIIAGDSTSNDSVKAWQNYFDWLERQDYRKKIMIAGNHDNFCTQWAISNDSIYDSLVKKPSFSYLCDSGEEFEGFKIWGSPWSQRFVGQNPHCMAFTLDHDNQLINKFEMIPHDTDILITHSPPFGILDKTTNGEHVGSTYLFNWLKYVGRPKLHVFGHIHEAYGQCEIFSTYNNQMMKSINASHVNEDYEPVNKPIRIILEGKPVSQEEESGKD